MTSSSNVYQDLLGIPHLDPDYYTLLGISRDEMDAARIKDAAEKVLEKLETLTDNDQRDDTRRLVKHVKAAYLTLINLQRRAKYDKGLASSEIKIAIPSPSPEILQATTIADAFPTAPLKMAVPIAVPRNQLFTNAAPVPALDGSAVRDENEKLKVVPPRKSKKRSATGLPLPLLIMILVVGSTVVVGLIFFAAKGAWIGAAKPKSNPAVRTAAGASSSDTVTSVDTPATSIVDTDNSAPFIGNSPDAKSEQALDQKERLVATVDERQNSDSAAESDAEKSVVEPDLPNLTDDQSETTLALRRQTARRFFVAISHRDWPRSKDLAAWLEKSDVDALGLVPGGFERALELASGFWKQVTQSTIQHATGVELTIGSETVGFIEASNQHVMFKMKGVTCKAYFESLPISMLIQLGESGAVEDIPVWRLQQAVAFLASPNSARTNEAKILRLLEQSETDGHDVESLKGLLAFQMQEVKLNDALAAWPLKEERSDAAIKAAELMPPVKIAARNIAGLKNDADKAIALAIKTEPSPARFGLLDRALSDSIRLCDLRACHEVLTLISEGYQVDMDARLLGVSMEMIPHASSPDQARRICNSILQLSGNGLPDLKYQPTTKRELDEVQKLARRFKLNDVLDQVELLRKSQQATK
jgi:hypothetical protein